MYTHILKVLLKIKFIPGEDFNTTSEQLLENKKKRDGLMEVV